jgi:hypothetical protein
MDRMARVVSLFLMLFLLVPLHAQESGKQDTRKIPETIDHRVYSAAQIEQLRKTKSYQPVLRDDFFSLLKQYESNTQADHSIIERAEYSATLSGTDLLDGRVSFQLEGGSDNQTSRRLTSFGATNLQKVRLFSADEKLDLSTDSAGRLISLKNLTSPVINGSWVFQGAPVGQAVVFQLKLPAASICKLTLKASSEIEVESANALIRERTDETGNSQWTLYPENSTAVTISCTRRSEDLSTENTGLAVDCDCKIRKYGSVANWNVEVPESLADTILLLGFSRECDVQSVTLGNGSPLRWDIVSADEQKRLRVWVPTAQGDLSFDIETQINVSEDLIEVPFLVPDSWQPALTEIGGALLLRDSSVRVTVSPEFVVTNVETEGVFEEHVQFLGDDSQLLKLKQFSQTAHARLSTVISKPVVEDSIVVLPSTDPGRMDAYVSVVARSGSIGTLLYDVPASWRVTEVSEPVTSAPILFRLSDSTTSAAHSTLHVTLRAPLVAGRVQASQNLRIRLQSAAGQRQREVPTLVNRNYQRRQDYIVTTTEGGRVRPLPGVDGVSMAELLKQLPWLPPVDEADQKVAFARTDLLLAPEPDATTEQLVATLDYSVSAAGGNVTESVQLNLQSSGELPSEVLIHATPGVDLTIAADADSSAVVSLRRIGSGRRHDDWQLRISRDNSIHEFRGELTTTRKLVSSMAATMVEIPRGSLQGGTVRPPADAAEVLLVDTDGRTIRQTQQYPDRPFDSPLRLQAPVAESAPLTVSGNAFLITEAVKDGLRTHARYQMHVRAGRNSAQLEMTCANVASLQVFVDGKPVYAENVQDVYRIPLSTSQMPMEVDVFVATRPMPHEDTYSVPVLTLRNADSTQLNCFVLTPANRMPESSDGVLETQPESIAAVTRMAIGGSRHAAKGDFFRANQQFASQWQFHAAQSDIACVVASQPADGVLRMRLYDMRFDASKKLITIFVVCLMFLVLLHMSAAGWWLAGIGLLILALIHHRSPFDWQPFIEGGIYGTIIAGLIGILRRLKWKPGSSTRQLQKVTLRSAVVLLMVTSVCGFDEESLPQVLVPDTALPILYVEGDWLTQLRTNAQTRNGDALVVDTELHLKLLSPDSAAVEFRCDVAAGGDQACELILPLQGLTLVECTLDGKPVFPTRNTAGDTTIVIPPQSVLPSKQLIADDTQIAAAGPSTIGNFLRRTVCYTVRVIPDVSSDALQFLIPHPPAPEARLIVTDPLDIAAAANRIGTAGRVTDFRNQRVTFPPSYNSRAFDVAIRLKKTETQAPVIGPSCEVVCRAEVSEAEVRLACEYRDLPVDPKSQTVRIGNHHNYGVMEVKSLSGKRLQWSMDRDELVIRVDAELSESRQLVVQRVIKTALSLKQKIPLQEISTVNGMRAAIVTLTASTSGLFFVNAVVDGDVSLMDVSASTLPKLPAGLRPTDRVMAVPPQTSAVEVQLARQQTGREARLVQKVLVTEQEIQWSCRCEFEITGQPAFRQTLQLSPDVQIQSVTASNSEGEVSRLQAWFRNDELITVALREGIRGSLNLEIRGTLKREPNVDTALPVIGLPTEPLESFLEISSSPDSDIFISDFGGAIPNSPFDLRKTPIPDKPMTLSVIHDSRPLVIRANPERRIVAQMAVVAYQTNQQTFLAQYLLLQTPDAPFSTSFEVPQAAAFATSEVWVGQAGEFLPVVATTEPAMIRVPPESDGSVIVVVSDIVMARDIDRVFMPIPDFGSELTITEVQAFDLRSDDATTAMPEWLQAATERTKLVKANQPGRLLQSHFDAETQKVEIRIALPQRTQEIRQASGGPAFAAADHQLRVQGRELITGASGFLVFSMQENQPVSIRLPVGTVPTAVRVDGVALPFAVVRNTLSVAAAGRVSLIAVDWLHSMTEPNQQHGDVPLPRVQAAQTSTFATVLQGGKSGWGLTNATRDAELTVKDRLRSLTTGLQMIESETLSEVGPSEAPTSEIQATLPNGPVWQKLVKESPAATVEFARFLKGFAVSPPGMQRVDVSDPEHLHFSLPTIPSATIGLSLLFAAVMFLVPIVGQRKTPGRIHAEASTVVTQPQPADQEEPTMIGVDLPE